MFVKQRKNFFAMNRNGIEQTPGQALVVGTAFLDVDEAQWRKNNDHRRPDEVYRGASSKEAFRIQDKELMLGRRNNESLHNEVGWTSLSGLPLTGAEGNIRSTYVIGITRSASHNQDGGVAVIKSGTATIINNGDEDIFAGDYVAYEFPKEDESTRTLGSSRQKVLPKIVPFHKGDMHTPRMALLASMNSTEPGFGIGDLSMDSDVDTLTPIQEEALGLKYGEMLKIKRVIEYREGPEAAQEWFDDNIGNAAELLKELFFDDADGSKAFVMAQKARDGAMMARWNTVFGKALNNASANGGSLDVMM